MMEKWCSRISGGESFLLVEDPDSSSPGLALCVLWTAAIETTSLCCGIRHVLNRLVLLLAHVRRQLSPPPKR